MHSLIRPPLRVTPATFPIPGHRHYKYDMTDEEAIELGKRAIYHATHRDAYSGSINNVYIVKPTGWVKVHAGDVNDMHYKLAEEKAAIAAARVAP